MEWQNNWHLVAFQMDMRKTAVAPQTRSRSVHSLLRGHIPLVLRRQALWRTGPKVHWPPRRAQAWNPGMKSVSHRPPQAKTLRVNSTLEWRKEGKKENATVIPTGNGPIPRTLVLSTAHKGPEGIPGPHPKKKKEVKGAWGLLASPTHPDRERREAGTSEERDLYLSTKWNSPD